MSRWCSNQLSYVPAVRRHSTEFRRAVNIFFAANPMNMRIFYFRSVHPYFSRGWQAIFNSGRIRALVKNIKQRFQDGEHALPQSYYAASANAVPPRPVLQGEVETDVCVIGAGYTGLSSALFLLENGFRVTVLEAAKVGFG